MSSEDLKSSKNSHGIFRLNSDQNKMNFNKIESNLTQTKTIFFQIISLKNIISKSR